MRENNVKIKINHQIKSSQVVLINSSGVNVGLVSFVSALKEAQDAGLDLIEVARDKSNNAVCKIMDYGKYKFDQQKKQKAQKQKILDLKEVQVRPVTDYNDLQTKAEKIKSWIEDGHKVQIICKFSGRELEYKHLGRGIIEDLLGLIGQYKIDQPMKDSDRKLIITIGKEVSK